MPIKNTRIILIKNIYPRNITQNMRDDFFECLNLISYSDIFRGPGTLSTFNTIRIDMQGHINLNNGGKQYNIQAQVNNIQGMSTVAHILVDDTISNDDPLNQLGAFNKVKAALISSLDDKHTYSVSGSIP